MKHRKQAPLRSDIAWSTPDRIGVFGYDLPRELIGHVNLGDMGFLEVVGRLPSAAESQVFNALLVTLVEHGLTPSAIATRMTYTGAPESMQAAVAAGLSGWHVFVGTIEGAGRILFTAIPIRRPGLRCPHRPTGSWPTTRRRSKTSLGSVIRNTSLLTGESPAIFGGKSQRFPGWSLHPVDATGLRGPRRNSNASCRSTRPEPLEAI